MGEAALWGALGASSLIVAAEIAFAVRLPRMVIGLIMAFGVGALISSVSFELVEPALTASATWKVGLGLAVGSLTFFLGDRAIARLGGSARKQLDANDEPSRSVSDTERDADATTDEAVADDQPDDEGGGLGIALGTVLDGIPESAVLGMSLVGGGSVSVSLLAGIWISNLPEALGSTVNMRSSGWTTGRVRLLWWSVIVVSAVAAAIGFVVVENVSGLNGALVQAFAAGALITMIADEMAPEAFDRSRILTGPATVAGFALAVWLTSLE